MEASKNFDVQSNCSKSSSFSRKIYSEVYSYLPRNGVGHLDRTVVAFSFAENVEEVGWESLVKMGDDLRFLSFRVLDSKGREHILEITLDMSYPKCLPSISADVPCNMNLEWSPNSKLRDVIQQFKEHINKLQQFWSTLDDIDQTLWVTDPKFSSLAIRHRQINIGNNCYIVLFINATDPLSLPECRFLGSDAKVNIMRETWLRNCKRWAKDKSIPENLACVFGATLPQPPHVQKSEGQAECGICYSQHLPIDAELGARSGGATDYKCENGNCKRDFHIVCLGDWLRSITTTRQSFDVLFGNCPYCSDPIAVKIGIRNQMKLGSC